MGLPGDGFSECGEVALSGCSRCGRPICASHRIASDPGLSDPTPSEVFCPACWRNRGKVRKTSDVLERLKVAWNVVLIIAILGGLLHGFGSWLFGSK